MQPQIRKCHAWDSTNWQHEDAPKHLMVLVGNEASESYSDEAARKQSKMILPTFGLRDIGRRFVPNDY